MPDLDLHVQTDQVKETSDEAETVEAVPLRDVDKLLATASKKVHAFAYWMRAAILLACEAGLRNGEIRAAQWTDIKDGQLTIRRALSDQDVLGPPKNGKPRTVPLSPRLRDELDKLPRVGIWIIARTSQKFGGKHLRYKPMLVAAKRLYAAAGVTMPRSSKTKRARPWHGLRHTYGTQLVRAGAHDKELMELMGHSDVRTAMIYVNPEARDKAALVARAFG
jgi:integrase